MVMELLCPPAILYIAFSITQIIIDIFKKMYNTALFKFIVMIVFSIALNLLCQQGLGIISWFIVFIPFILMTIVTTMLLYVFGLDPKSGNLDYNAQYPPYGNPQQPAESAPPVVAKPPGPMPPGPMPPGPVPPPKDNSELPTQKSHSNSYSSYYKELDNETISKGKGNSTGVGQTKSTDLNNYNTSLNK